MSTIAAKPVKTVRVLQKKSERKMTIGERIDMIEMATVASLRALQMDIENDNGIDSEIVLRDARRALR